MQSYHTREATMIYCSLLVFQTLCAFQTHSSKLQYADCLQDGSVNLVCRREVQFLLIRVVKETFDPLFCLEVRKHTHIRLWKVEIKGMG